MKIGLPGWIIIGILVIGGALNPTLALSLLFRVGAGIFSGGINAIYPKEQPPIIINIPPQQQNPERGYEAQ